MKTIVTVSVPLVLARATIIYALFQFVVPLVIPYFATIAFASPDGSLRNMAGFYSFQQYAHIVNAFLVNLGFGWWLFDEAKRREKWSLLWFVFGGFFGIFFIIFFYFLRVFSIQGDKTLQQ